jgi:hypothetical protein
MKNIYNEIKSQRIIVMNNEKLYEAVFDYEIYVKGIPKKVKRIVHLTKEDKDQHDALIKDLENATLIKDAAKKNYQDHELTWEKLKKDDKYWAEHKKLVRINTELSHLVNGASYKIFMFEYNWKRRGYEEYEIDYPDGNLEIDAAEDEMKRWDEEDPTWRIANDLD